MHATDGNLYDIQNEFQQYFSTHDRSAKGKGYKVFKRWEHFVAPRVYPSGDLSQLNNTALNFESYKKQFVLEGKGKGGNTNQLASSTFTPMGPFGAISGNGQGQFLKSGRINFITIDPSNSNNLWVGTPAGGLWTSTNGGVTWSTSTDNLAVIGCADLALHPAGTQTMYLATGDGDGSDTPSIGVLKSTDGGATWSATGLVFSKSSYVQIHRLIINPSNPLILIAATNNGVYRTVNGGTNWSSINNVHTYDLEFNPANPNIVYAAGNSFRISNNGGASFTLVTNGISASNASRMAIAVTPANSSYVYVLSANGNDNGFGAVYRSVTSGTSFATMSGTNTPNLLGWADDGSDSGGQGWYDLCIAASPLDADEIVIGGVNVWRSLNGGASWLLYGHWVGQNAPFTHADQHDLEFDASGTLFVTNDGTVYRRTSFGWSEISGTMNISQIYKIGLSSNTANKWITGHQDNGTSIFNGSTYNALLGGDGMDCFIDRTTDQNLFGSYQNGYLMKSGNGGSSWSACINGLPSTGPWVTIWKQDPVVSSRLFCGFTNMYVSNNLGNAWSQLGTLPGSGDVIEFAISKSNNTVMYVLRPSGIYKTTNSGSSWSNITGSIPVSFAQPAYVAIDPTDENNAWVVLSSFSSGNKVFVTTNGGSSWTNISGNLPNIPANCIVYQPSTNDRIYVGMDIGIYVRDNSSSNWSLYNAGLPNVPVSELEISPASPTLLHAATYGRGVWVASLVLPTSAPLTSYTLTSGIRCTPATVVYNDQSSNGPTAFSWSVNPSNGVAINSSSVSTPTVTFNSPGVYTVSLLASNNVGPGSIFSQTILISATPQISIAASAPTICAGSLVSFTASGAGSYTWANASNAPVVSFTPMATTVYSVSGTLNSCVASQTYTIYSGPAASMSIIAPDFVCPGVPVTINASGALSYTWSNKVQGPVTTVTPTSVQNYSVTGITSGGCYATALKQIALFQKPLITETHSDSMICAGNQFNAFASGALTYTWFPDNIEGDWNLFAPLETTTFVVTGSDLNGCENSAQFVVIVDECTSVQEQLKIGSHEFSLYPNPTKGILRLVPGDVNVSSVTIRVTDINGKVVRDEQIRFTEQHRSHSIDLGQNSAGVYFLQLEVDGNVSTKVRIIKE